MQKYGNRRYVSKWFRITGDEAVLNDVSTADCVIKIDNSQRQRILSLYRTQQNTKNERRKKEENGGNENSIEKERERENDSSSHLWTTRLSYYRITFNLSTPWNYMHNMNGILWTVIGTTIRIIRHQIM